MNIDYIAGFFDGEGSIVIKGNKITISLPQTNEEVLINIKEYFGVGNVYPLKKRKEHWKDAWCYRCNGSIQCFKILKELEPHLILKRGKAKNALKIIEIIKNKHLDKINRNKYAVSLVLKEGMSYRKVEKITGICRQILCNEMKKIRSIGEKESQLSV